MSFKRRWLIVFALLLAPGTVGGQDFKKLEAKIAQYRGWLNQLQSYPYRYWTRLDSSRRPHRLYVGEGFYEADHEGKERFIEIFSHTVAGHPEKYMLIDIFDSETGTAVGEFGWGGFRLYPNRAFSMELQAPASRDTR